jgi:hypothetical protein
MEITNPKIPRSQLILALIIILFITLLAFSQLFVKGLSSPDDFVPIYPASMDFA